MAEAVAIIGLLASMGQLAEFSMSLVSRVKHFMVTVDELPNCFAQLSIQLPLLATIVRSLRHRAASEWGHESPEIQKDLARLIMALESELQSIDALLVKTMPSEGASSVERGIKALKSFKVQSQVEQHVEAVRGYINILNTFLTFRSEEGVGILIRRLTDQTTLEQPPPRKRVNMVEVEAERNFVGRDDILQEISSRYASGVQRVAISGLGGVGKSRIATEHCHALLKQGGTCDIFWVHAATYEKFQSSYRKVARLLNVRGWDDKEVDVLALVCDHLREDTSPWFMVIDNADDHDVWLHSDGSKPLITFLPICQHGQILITTRDSQLGRKLLEQQQTPIAIPHLEQNAAILLLRAKLDQGSHLDHSHASELTTALGHLPLTITQAAAYLNEIEMSASEYLTAFKKGLSELPELLSESVDDPLRDRANSNSIFQTWRISFEHLTKHDPRAAQMLCLMAMLDRQSITKDLLQQPGESPLQFKKATSRLKAFSLIDEDYTTGTFSMHQLVQLSMQRWISQQQSETLYRRQAIAAVARCCPLQGCFDTWQTFADLTPHFKRVVPVVVVTTDDNLDLASILHSFGHYHISLGQDERAYALLKRASQMKISLLGHENESTLSTQALLGSVYSATGARSLNDARALIQSVLERSERLLGPKHRLTLKTRSRLAIIQSKQGKFRAAKIIHIDVLRNMEQVLGTKDTDTLKEMSHLLYIHNSLQEWEEAYEVGQRCLQLRTDVLGPKHPDTVTIMSQLCWTYNAQTRWNEALELGERVLNLRLDTLGADHPKTMVAMRNLVQAFRGLDRYEDALQLQRYVFESRKRVLGTFHKSTMIAMRQLKALEGRTKSDVSVVSTRDVASPTNVSFD